MNVEHQFTIVGRCPVNGARDEYLCIVRTDHVIEVEIVLREVDVLLARPVHQESLTQSLADVLATEVETVGVHSGVRTTCRCLPK